MVQVRAGYWRFAFPVTATMDSGIEGSTAPPRTYTGISDRSLSITIKSWFDVMDEH